MSDELKKRAREYANDYALSEPMQLLLAEVLASFAEKMLREAAELLDTNSDCGLDGENPAKLIRREFGL